MAWSVPLTGVSNATLTAAQWNASVRDNLLETAPAKATAAGQIFAATGTNAIAARTPTSAANNGTSTTASLTYTDLAAGAGPSLTVTTGPLALIIVSSRNSNSLGTAESYCGFDISGATTLAGDDNTAHMFQPETANRNHRASAATLITPNAGSNTFTLKYRVSGGTGTFSARRVVVIPF